MYTNKTRLHATFKNRKTVETWNTIPPERYFTLSRQSNTHMRTWWLSSPMKHFCGTFFINLCRFHAAEHKRVLFSRQTPARLIRIIKKKNPNSLISRLKSFLFRLRNKYRSIHHASPQEKRIRKRYLLLIFFVQYTTRFSRRHDLDASTLFRILYTDGNSIPTRYLRNMSSSLIGDAFKPGTPGGPRQTFWFYDVMILWPNTFDPLKTRKNWF